MAGPPVVITEKFGIPVRSVASGAPVVSVAANGLGIPIVLSDHGAPFVIIGGIVPPDSPPEAFTGSQWALTDMGIGGTLSVAIYSLPTSDATITAVQYSVDSGAWTTSGGTSSFQITGLTNDTEYSVRIRAVSSAGSGDPSTAKTATPTVAALTVDMTYNKTTADFEIHNAIDFPEAVWVWETELGGVIAGATGTVLASALAGGDFVFVYPAGNEAAASQHVAASQDNTVIDADFFSVPNGTQLNGWNGFVGPNGFTFNNGKIYAASKITGHFDRILNGDTTVGVPAEQTSQRIIFTIDNNGEDDGYGYMSAREVMLQVSGQNQYLQFACRGTNAGLAKRWGAGGSVEGFGDVNLWDGTSHIPNGTKFMLEAVWIGGELYLRSLVQKPGTAWKKWHPLDVGLGIPVNATTTAIPGGNAMRLAGVSGEYNGSEYPLPMFRDGMFVEAWTNEPAISISEVSFVAPTLDGGFKADISGESTATGTHQIRYIDEEGRALSPFYTFEVTGGTFEDVPIPVPIALTGSTTTSFYVRPNNDPDGAAISLITQIPFYEPVEETILGINFDGPVSYVSDDLPLDIADRTRWVYQQDGLDLIGAPTDKDGRPLGPTPAGYTRFCQVVFEGRLFRGGRVGTYRWELPGNTHNFYAGSLENVTSSNKTATSIDLTIVDPNVKASAWVVLTDINVPVEGLPVQPTIRFLGESYVPGQRISTQAISDWNGVGARSMKIDMTESRNPAYSPLGTPEFWAGYARDVHPVVYRTFAHWMSEADIIDWIERFYAAAPSNAVLYCEMLNEYWNQVYWEIRQEFQAQGFTAGDWTEGAGQIPEGTIVTQEIHDQAGKPVGIDKGTNTTLRVFNPVEVFMYERSDNSSNLIMVVSPTPLPVGTVIPANTDANFKYLIKNNWGMMNIVGFRHLTRRQKRLGQIGKSIMGGRFVSVLGVDVNMPANDLADYVCHVDGYEFIDHTATTFYAGAARSYSSAPWVAAYADLPTFRAGYFAWRREAADGVIADRRSKKHAFREAMIGRGVPVDKIPTMMAYEGGDHCVIWDIPNEHRAGVLAAVKHCKQHTDEYTEMYHLLTECRQKIGGPSFYFISAEDAWFNSGAGEGGGQVQAFGFRTQSGPSHTGEQAYLAFKQIQADIESAA